MGRLLLLGAPLCYKIICSSPPSAFVPSPRALINPVSRQFGCIFEIAIVTKVIIASQVCDDVTDNNSNQSFVLGYTSCELNDHASTIILAIIWVLSHAILLLNMKFPIIMTNHVRLAAPCTMS